MNLQRDKEILLEYLPSETIEDILLFLKKHKVQFKITRGRKTKLGDYCCPQNGNLNHKITVNANLSKYGFLLVALHEFAHLNTWLLYKNKVMPHGEEWKAEYKKIVSYFLKKNIFPSELAEELYVDIQNPAATMVRNPKLIKLLRKYSEKSQLEDRENRMLLSEIQDNAKFCFSNRTFIRLEKQRTRYKCKSLDDGRLYLISQNAPIEILN